MNVYWILADDDTAEGALAAVGRQLAEGDHGSPTLAEALRMIRFEAEIAHGEVLQNRRPLFAPAINSFRRGLTKLLWWYGLPQWGQVSEYQRSATKVIDVLLAQQRRLQGRVTDLEARIAALETREKPRP